MYNRKNSESGSSFSFADRQEVWEVIREEDELLNRSNDEENFTLLGALAGNWDIRQFISVARYHGKSWRFLSALADKSLQLQGYAMLDFMADAMGRDLALQVYEKARTTFARAERMKKNLDDRYGTNELLEQIFAEMCDDFVEWTAESRQRYWRRIGPLTQ